MCLPGVSYILQMSLDSCHEAGKLFHKKGTEYANYFLNSSVFGLGTFRFPLIVFLKHMNIITKD